MLTSLCADLIHAGRIDHSMLSDSQLLELLFVPENEAIFRESMIGDDETACSWPGVHCDADARIISIHWDFPTSNVAGSVNFPMLPPEITTVHFSQQQLTGFMDSSHLPRKMHFFYVRRCLFAGTVALDNLPPTLQYLYVCGNAITHIGTIRNVPETLRFIQIREASVKQELLCIEKLPPGMKKVKITSGIIRKIDLECVSDTHRVVWKSKAKEKK